MQAEEQSGLPGEPVETYQTSNGLTLQIFNTENTGDANHAPQITIIFAMAPDGTTFTISSTLPLDQIKAWAEDLAPIG